MPSQCPVVHFDHHSAAFGQDRTRILRQLRTTTPLAYTESHGGHWVVTSYALATIVLENPEVFSSAKAADGSRGVTIPSVPVRLLPAETDPPLHTQLRKAIAGAYSPRALKAMEPSVREIVRESVDRIVAKGAFDIVEDIAEMVPPLVGLRHLGFPDEHRATMVGAIKTALHTGVPPEAAGKAFQAACGMMLSFAQSRRQAPSDDMMSTLVGWSDPPLSDEDLMWMGLTLFVGGFKNPGAHISNMLLHLGQDLSLRRRLIQDRSLIPKATNEFLRFYTAGVSVARTVTRNFELGGIGLSAGDRILVLLPSANHDDAAFANAEVFDLERPPQSRHLAFGGGPHFCVGFKLATIMFEVLLNEIFDRIPAYTVDAEKAVRVEDAGIQAGYVVIPAHTGLVAAVA